VATCGTSFGEDHIKVLRRLIMDSDSFMGEVIFTFDGDAGRAAGRAAARSAWSRKFATQTYVDRRGPTASTRATCGSRHGDGAVRDLIARPGPRCFEFAIKGVLGHHNLDTTEGQPRGAGRGPPRSWPRSRDQGLRTRYAVNLDRWLGLMDERFVLARVRAHAGDTGPAAPVGPARNRSQPNRGKQPGSFRDQWRRTGRRRATVRPG